MKSLLLIALLLITCPLSAITDQEPSGLKATMHTFVTALDMIQNGILYNNSEKMNEGVRILKETERNFLERHGETLQRFMPEDPTFANSYARNVADKLHHQIRSLDNEIRFRQEYSNTADTYGRIIQLCTECHLKFRE